VGMETPSPISYHPILMYYVGKAGKGIRILQEAEACSSHIQLVMFIENEKLAQRGTGSMSGSIVVAGLIVLAVGPNALYNVQSQS
jgi:hypothetical protein